VTIGVSMKKPLRGKVQLAFRQYRKNQVLLVLRGSFRCEMEGGIWIVPPQSAIWVPGGGVMRNAKVWGAFEGYNAFIDPAVSAGLPSTCCVISTTPLLRELLVSSASLPTHYPEGGRETHLVTLLLDEVAMAPAGNLYLPMPKDRRLRKMVDRMMDHPDERGTMETWAGRAGLSVRTLARVLVSETGMSFGRWRQQLNLLLALQWLAGGSSVQQVAADLGYESAGSFVTMFRKALGTSPGRYMAERCSGQT
jgi:AraC-like DNA-binding protein